MSGVRPSVLECCVLSAYSAYSALCIVFGRTPACCFPACFPLFRPECLNIHIAVRTDQDKAARQSGHYGDPEKDARRHWQL